MSSFDGTHREPANITAALVVSKGIRHRNEPKMANAHWEHRPPTKPLGFNMPKLIGMRFGRLTVIGLHATLRGAWVVRCDCGDYETRKAKAIRNTKNSEDRCTLCRNAAHQRRNYEWRTTGREVNIRDL